jgi:hypothetical protein
LTRLRFLLDDAPQCETQQAILSAFATDLEERAQAEVVLSSRLTELRHWSDAPPGSSHRLALRLHALQPAPHLWTVFLPGHIVPGSIASVSRWGGALATREFTTVADLDVFAVDNTHLDCEQLRDFAAAHPDYEAISRYASLSATDIPAWLVAGGLTSARQLTQRPWYSAFAQTRLQWLGWAKKAMERGLLNLAMVEEDVRTGRVRPSLLAEIRALLEGTDAPLLPDLTLDPLFIAPERRLTDPQYRLLHSSELQERTLKFARRNSARKGSKRGLLKYFQRLFKRFLKFLWFSFWELPQRVIRATYLFYPITARPAVQRWREQSRSRE